MRFWAALIDTILAFLLTALLASSAGWFFAERAAVTFRVYSPDTYWNGPIPLMLGAVSPLSYGLAFAVIVALACEGMWGASVGKILTRRTVVKSSGGAPSRRRSWLRFALKTSPWWVFCLALMSGRWEWATFSGIVGLWALLDLASALVFRHHLWHDRISGTRVVVRPNPGFNSRAA